jgi:hypothetical protein
MGLLQIILCFAVPHTVAPGPSRGWVLIAKDGNALGYAADSALAPLHYVLIISRRHYTIKTVLMRR